MFTFKKRKSATLSKPLIDFTQEEKNRLTDLIRKGYDKKTAIMMAIRNG